MRGVVVVGLGEAKYNMLQQWLLRLGMVFFAAILGSGAAFASDDLAPADPSLGTTLQQDSSPDVENTTSGNVQVDVSSDSQQTQEGASGGGSDVNSNDTSSASPLADSSQAAPSGTESSNDGGSVLSDDSGLSSGVSDSGQPPVASQAKAGGQMQTAFAVTSIMKKLAQHAIPPVGQLAQAATAVHTSNTPNTPPTPTGLLGDLRSLFTTSLIPGLKSLSGQLAVFASSTTILSLQLALIVLLVLVASLLLISFYLARLRRSGYTDAARSDAGAAAFYFATPPQMGFMSVPITL